MDFLAGVILFAGSLVFVELASRASIAGRAPHWFSQGDVGAGIAIAMTIALALGAALIANGGFMMGGLAGAATAAALIVAPLILFWGLKGIGRVPAAVPANLPHAPSLDAGVTLRRVA